MRYPKTNQGHPCESTIKAQQTNTIRHPPLVLETQDDRQHALQQIGGPTSRWLEAGELSDLFKRMEDGFKKQAALHLTDSGKA
ncbi:MAG: hypothetical protein GY952_11915 [Rhodobacteraceae bacterium]|nr:hypothetical protein [Paracoccaceae bacterium]